MFLPVGAPMMTKQINLESHRIGRVVEAEMRRGLSFCAALVVALEQAEDRDERQKRQIPAAGEEPRSGK